MDFYCPKAKLVLEIYGGWHKSANSIKKDTVKDITLGLKVLRFDNNDITENIEGVLERILSNID